MLAILIVALFGFFLYTNQAGTATESIDQIASSFVSYENNLRIGALFTTNYIVYADKDLPLIRALTYGCEYGETSDGFSYFISEPEGVVVNPKEFLDLYWQSQLEQNYRFVLDCNIDDPDSHQLIVGNETPEQGQIEASQILVPRPYENMTRAYLYRWQ